MYFCRVSVVGAVSVVVRHGRSCSEVVRRTTTLTARNPFPCPRAEGGACAPLRAGGMAFLLRTTTRTQPFKVFSRKKTSGCGQLLGSQPFSSREWQPVPQHLAVRSGLDCPVVRVQDSGCRRNQRRMGRACRRPLALSQAEAEALPRTVTEQRGAKGLTVTGCLRRQGLLHLFGRLKRRQCAWPFWLLCQGRRSCLRGLGPRGVCPRPWLQFRPHAVRHARHGGLAARHRHVRVRPVLAQTGRARRHRWRLSLVPDRPREVLFAPHGLAVSRQGRPALVRVPPPRALALRLRRPPCPAAGAERAHVAERLRLRTELRALVADEADVARHVPGGQCVAPSGPGPRARRAGARTDPGTAVQAVPGSDASVQAASKTGARGRVARAARTKETGTAAAPCVGPATHPIDGGHSESCVDWGGERPPEG